MLAFEVAHLEHDARHRADGGAEAAGRTQRLYALVLRERAQTNAVTAGARNRRPDG